MPTCKSSLATQSTRYLILRLLSKKRANVCAVDSPLNEGPASSWLRKSAHHCQIQIVSSGCPPKNVHAIALWNPVENRSQRNIFTQLDLLHDDMERLPRFAMGPQVTLGARRDVDAPVAKAFSTIEIQRRSVGLDERENIRRGL